MVASRGKWRTGGGGLPTSSSSSLMPSSSRGGVLDKLRWGAPNEGVGERVNARVFFLSSTLALALASLSLVIVTWVILDGHTRVSSLTRMGTTLVGNVVLVGGVSLPEDPEKQRRQRTNDRLAAIRDRIGGNLPNYGKRKIKIECDSRAFEWQCGREFRVTRGTVAKYFGPPSEGAANWGDKPAGNRATENAEMAAGFPSSPIPHVVHFVTGFFNASVEEGGANPNCGAIPREYVRFMLQYLYVHSGSDWSFRVHCPHQIEALLEEKSPELMPIYKVRSRKQTRAGEREREGGNVCVCVCVCVLACFKGQSTEHAAAALPQSKRQRTPSPPPCAAAFIRLSPTHPPTDTLILSLSP